MSFSTFAGEARRLDSVDIPRIASRTGIGIAELMAFMEVEAGGCGFDNSRRPKMLFEPHVFYRLLKHDKTKLQRARDEGLAYPEWGKEPYPRCSYDRLHRAIEIDEDCALMSCSWGLGQIMGFNHKIAGYESPHDMITDFMLDEEFHVEALCHFIIRSGIDDDLRAHRWAEVARVYNGSGYERHGYHTRLADAYARHSLNLQPRNTQPDATVKDLRQAGSRTIRASDRGQTAGAIAIATGAVTAASEVVGVAENASTIVGRVRSLIGEASVWLLDIAPLIMIASGIVVVIALSKVKAARLDDHRTGKNTGR